MSRLVPISLALLCLATSVAANSQVSDDCTTIESCQARINAQKVDSLQYFGGDVFLNAHDWPVPFPSGITAEEFDIGSLAQNFVTLTGTTPVAFPMMLPKQDTAGPNTGWTLAMFGVPPSNAPGVQGLVSFAVPAAQGGETILSLGLDASRGLLIRYGSDEWVTLWDPPQKILQSTSGNGYYLALRFRSDGKLLVDMFLRNDQALTPDCTLLANCYRYGVLLDYGWPMPKFPDGKNAKSYYPITKVLLGAEGTSKPAIQEIYNFSGTFTENMLQTLVIGHGTDSGENFINPSIGSNNSACNSGDIFFQPTGATNLSSLCGNRPAEFVAPIKDPQLPIGILNLDSHGFAYALDSGGNKVFFTPYFGSFLGPQIWSIVDYDKRARNYKFKNFEGKLLVNDNDTLHLSDLDTNEPNFWWHLDTETGYFRSVTGGLALTSDHITNSATLNNLGMGDSQYMQFKPSGPLSSATKAMDSKEEEYVDP